MFWLWNQKMKKDILAHLQRQDIPAHLQRREEDTEIEKKVQGAAAETVHRLHRDPVVWSLILHTHPSGGGLKDKTRIALGLWLATPAVQILK